jgi:hypothetical protein
MNFQDLNQIQQFLALLPRYAIGSRRFEPILINSFEFSIFAGKDSFCQPQLKSDSLLHYTSVEVEIMSFKVANRNPENLYCDYQAISPLTDDRFKSFDWAKFFVYSDNKSSTIISFPSYRGNYVPVDQLPVMLRDIYKISQLKCFF